MAVVAADLIAPTGELDPELFEATDPGGDTEARVEAAIAAIALASPSASDNAVTAWVYSRIYTAKANSLANQPTTMTVDGQSQGWAKHQIDHFRSLAARWLSIYNEDTDSTPTPAPRRSRSVRGRVVW
jgi:hypothetical protein